MMPIISRVQFLYIILEVTIIFFILDMIRNVVINGGSLVNDLSYQTVNC